MRKIVAAAAILSAFALSAPAFADTQVAAKPGAETVAAAEPLSKADARKVARDYLKDTDQRGLSAGKIKERDGKFHVELVNLGGVTVGTLVIDAATGKVETAG